MFLLLETFVRVLQGADAHSRVHLLLRKRLKKGSVKIRADIAIQSVRASLESVDHRNDHAFLEGRGLGKLPGVTRLEGFRPPHPAAMSTTWA